MWSLEHTNQEPGRNLGAGAGFAVVSRQKDRPHHYSVASMGCLDGAKLLRPTVDTPHSLEEFRGMKVSVDTSYYFHVAVRIPAAVAQYHAAPPVPVTPGCVGSGQRC